MSAQHGETPSVPAWTIQDRLRKARTHADLDQGQLAQRMEVSRGTINNYEHGRTQPKRLIVRLWALACGVPFDWVLNGEQPRQDDGPDGAGVCAARESNPQPADLVISLVRRHLMPVECAA